MKENSISEKKLFVMLSTELFALTSLMLPSILVGFVKTNGLPVLLGASGLLLFLAVYYEGCLGKERYSLDAAVKRQENRFLRKGIEAIYILRYFIHGLFLMVIFVNLIKEVLLPDYHYFWILVPVLLLTYITGGKQLRVRGRILEVLFPYIFVPLLVVLFLALFQVDYGSLPEQLWRVQGEGMNWTRVLYGTYGVLIFYQPVEFLFFLLPALSKRQETDLKENKKKRFSVLGAACVFVIIVNLIMYVASIGMFGTVRTGNKLWSALYIMQSIRLPGRFVERLDILFLAFWIFGSFALFSAYMYYGSRFAVGEDDWSKEAGDSNPEKSERRKKIGKWYTALWLLAILVLALWMKEPRRMFEFFVPYKMWIDFPLSVILPFFLYRKQGKRKILKKGISMLFALCFVTLLTGCQERADIEDKNYVMTIGIEKGEKKEFRLLYEIPDLSSVNEEKGGGKPRCLVYEVSSFKEAVAQNRTREDKKLDFGHLKAILISFDVMESDKIREKLLEELQNNDSIAGTTLIFFTGDEVDRIVELGGQKSSSFGEYVDKMIVNQKKEKNEKNTLSELLKDWKEEQEVSKIWLLHEEKEQLVLESEETNPNLLRFHIRGASDSLEDQNNKIKIKDAVLPCIQRLLKDADSKESCFRILAGSTEQINQWVQSACQANDCQYESNTYLCRESFPLKAYGDMIVPSGTYDALRIDLGKAEGTNWWCMMYPSLCLMDDVIGETETTEEEKKKEIKETEEEAAKYEGIYPMRKKSRYQIRWKIAEWFKKGILKK